VSRTKGKANFTSETICQLLQLELFVSILTVRLAGPNRATPSAASLCSNFTEESLVSFRLVHRASIRKQTLPIGPYPFG
jgi:hypothetical protein